MMKPVAQGPHDTGLLEYLEDIIGTDKYKPQLEEASKRQACSSRQNTCTDCTIPSTRRPIRHGMESWVQASGQEGPYHGFWLSSMLLGGVPLESACQICKELMGS